MIILSVMVAVVLAAPSSCLAEHEHCSQGPGWRSECTEKTGAMSIPTLAPHRRARVANPLARLPGQPYPPGGDPGRVEGERAGLSAVASSARAEASALEIRAPSAPSTPVGVTERQAATPAGFQQREVVDGR